jgi:VanZ family protein
MTGHPSTRLRDDAGLAWILAAIWTTVVLVAGGGLGSFASGSRYLGPLLQWLFPDASQATLARLYVVVRETAHVAEYAVLALLAQNALRFRWPGFRTRYGGAFAWVLLLASIDEIRQAFVASRTGSVADVGLDCIGGVLALGLAFAYTRAMHSRGAARERT